MHDGSDERRRGAALAHGIVHMFGRARAAGSDDRDGHGVHDGPGQGQFVAVTGAVGVDGVDAELARAQFLALARPFDGVDAHATAAALDDDLVAGGDALAHGHAQHVHAHHDGLRAESRRTVGHQIGIAHGRGVDGDLLGPGIEHGAHVGHGRDAAAHAEGDEDLRGHALHHVQEDAAFLGRGRDVVKDDLVRTFLIIAAGALHGVADVHVALELDALGQAAGAHVQAGDDSFAKHGAPRRSNRRNCAARSGRDGRSFPDGTARPTGRRGRRPSRTPSRRPWWP